MLISNRFCLWFFIYSALDNSSGGTSDLDLAMAAIAGFDSIYDFRFYLKVVLIEWSLLNAGLQKSSTYSSKLSRYFFITFLTSFSSFSTRPFKNGISLKSSRSSKSSPYHDSISMPLLGHVLQKFSFRLSIIIVFLISLPISLRSLTLWNP